ncbi:MAG TPA: cyclopropane-fatty-acyl-phospholipid synthase family protein [Candidatus Dormibacteraeota bacterium]|jgi:cyclopropane-fatty-acyl-phospholipid synthase|nr:cyclopropane-fatty-acyl-phospholipid synthase family protein [Candidatus Dormibacteraeota bacterium]
MVAAARMSTADRAARGLLLQLLRRVQDGRFVIVDADGEHVTGPQGGLAVRIDVHSPAVYRAVAGGSRGLARTYADGLWDTDDLVAMVRIAARAMDHVDPWRARIASATLPLQRASTAFRNTRARSRDNIERHYDLGNDFFFLVLDETMGYSCAYYERPDMAPLEASRANLDRVCRLLDLRPGERLLELGSGWGPLALHAAEHFGCHVSTVTISPAQREYIDKLARQRGVASLVEVIVQDYRDVRGSWDKVASLEMVESIGAAHLGTFAAQVGRLMRPEGLALIQAITTSDRLFRIERYNRTFINEYIFPGGHTPSVEAILDAFGRSTDMRTVAVHDITAHYPPTLRAWRSRLQENWPRIQALGRFDERFRRLWTLYFSWCEASFLERRVQDRQILLAGRNWRDEDRLLGVSVAGVVEPHRTAHVENGQGLPLPDANQEMQPAQ